MSKDTSEKVQLLEKIIQESKILSGEPFTNESLEKIINRIYLEIFPLPHNLPTLIFGEKHDDPATIRVVTKLAERLAEMKHSYSFYEELDNNETRKRYLAAFREEVSTGKLPFSDDGKLKIYSTSPASRAARVKLDDMLRKHRIPVECVDYPDVSSLATSFLTKTEIENNNNSTFLESAKKSKFLNERDDHMSRHYLSGNDVIGIVGSLHLEGIQKRIATRFTEIDKGPAVSANYCFFQIYSDDSKILTIEKEAKLPFEVVKINLTTLSEDEAVDLIIKTVQTAQQEMQTHGYWRTPHSDFAENLTKFNNLIEQISPGFINKLMTEAEKIKQEAPESKIQGSMSKEEMIINLFENPLIYREKIHLQLDQNLYPKELPERFKEFLLTEALAGRFDMLLKLKNPPLNLIAGQTTLLHAAVAAQNLLATGALIKRIPVNIPDSEGLTPLHIAATLGNLKIVNWLLFREAETRCVDKTGNTPIDMAATDSIRQRILEEEIIRRLPKPGFLSSPSMRPSAPEVLSYSPGGK